MVKMSLFLSIVESMFIKKCDLRKCMKTKLLARLRTMQTNKTNGGKLNMTTVSKFISKKILAIMVLAVFVLSIVPIVWAEDAQPGAENQAGDLGVPNQGQANQPNQLPINKVPQPNIPGQANKQGAQPFNQEPKQFNQVGDQPGKNQPGNKPFVNPKDNPMKVGPKFKEGKESQGQEGEFEGEFKEPQEGEDINSEVEDKEGKKEEQGFKPKFPQFVNDFFNKWKKQPFEPGAAEPQGQFGEQGQPNDQNGESGEPKGQFDQPGQPMGEPGEQGQFDEQGQLPPRMFESKSEGCWVGEEPVPCPGENQVPPELIERHRKFNQQFLEAKENYKEAKGKLVERRRELVQLKEKASACTEESEDCQEAKEQMLVGTQNHLLKTGEVMEGSLDKLVNRVEDSNVLTDAEKVEAKAKISELNEKIKAKLEEIEALTNGEINAAELRLKIKELKDLWQEVSKAQRWTVTQMINNKMENVVDKHMEYVNGMEMRVADLEKKGAAPERIEALKDKVEEFKEEVAVLAKYQEAADKAWEASKGDVTKGTFTEAKDKQQEMREQLKVTKEMLREFIVMYKEVYKATVKTSQPLPPVAEGTSPVSGETPESEAVEGTTEEASETEEETAEEADEAASETAESTTDSGLATSE